MTKTCKHCRKTLPAHSFPVADRRGARRGACRYCFNSIRRQAQWVKNLSWINDFDFDWMMIKQAMAGSRVPLSPDDQAVVVLLTLAQGGQVKEAAHRAQLTERSVQRIRITPTHRAYKVWEAWRQYQAWLHGEVAR